MSHHAPAESGESTHGATTADDPYVPHSGNGGYDVAHYSLELDYRVASNRLDGRAWIDLVTTDALSRLSFDLHGLAVSAVSMDGGRVRKFAVRGDKLHVWPEAPIPAGRTTRLEIRYSGNPRPVKGAWGQVGWEELQDGALVASQPNGAPSWFPCNDHPSSKATYRISITTESPYLVVANGSLVSRDVQASRTRWLFEERAPMAAYLATVQIGRYTQVAIDFGDSAESSGVSQEAAVPAGLVAAARLDLARQPRMMSLFQRVFGPYPFDSYTVVVTGDDLEIPIEAQGVSVFGSNHLDGQRGEERLVAHELAHQWFGNSLTVERWQHIWLNEGFACYAEWLWSEESGGPSADASARHHWGLLAQLPQDLVVADPGPDLMFDDRLYKRGALTLHALRLTIGDQAFFDVLRSWTSSRRHATVTTDDFVALVGGHAPDAQATHALLTEWLTKRALPTLPPAR